MTNLERTKLIDRYLAGEMSEEEKIGFERLLSEGDLSSIDKQSLRKEMELQKEIENAIRERGLREMLQREEAEIRHRQKVKKVTIWSLSSGSVITALAAVMLLLFVVAPVAHQMQDMSSRYVAQVEVGQLRGDNSYADALGKALTLMQSGEWDEASRVVNEVFESTDGASEEELIEMHDNAEWLKAICLMHEGKVRKAKRLLKKIADGESNYSIKAAEMLDELK